MSHTAFCAAVYFFLNCGFSFFFVTHCSAFFLAGVRRTWTNVSRNPVCTEASVSTTWTVSSACVTWTTLASIARWMSATSTCTSSWACGRTSSSWCPTWWSALTMSRRSNGPSRSTTRTHLTCNGDREEHQLSALQRQPIFGMRYESAYCKGESANGSVTTKYNN